MTAPLNFTPSNYPGGRIVLMLGQHPVGAIFPPAIEGEGGGEWRWRFWLQNGGFAPAYGRAKSELAAKNALLAEAKTWLQKGGVE